MKTAEKTEAALTQYMFQKATKNRIPISGTFELTPMCNFKCKMCYVRKTSQEVAQAERSQMTVERWLELAKELREEGMLYLLLTGGEPFSWPGFWELYEQLSQMGFLISINSNGSMIDERVVERLRKNPPTRINITLYGASDETYRELCQVEGMYTKVCHNIKKIQEAGIPVKLNCSLTPCNVKDLDAIVDFAKERELLLEIATYMFPPVRRDKTMVGQNERLTPYEAAYYNLKRYYLQYGEEEYIRFLKRAVEGIIPPLGLEEGCVDSMNGKIRCRAAKSVFWITWDGWLTPCGMLNKPCVDIKNQKFKDSWKALIQKSEALKLSGVCTKCTNREICHSCGAIAMAETGKFDGIPKYLCETMTSLKKIAEDNLKAYQKKEEIG